MDRTPTPESHHEQCDEEKSLLTVRNRQELLGNNVN